VRCAAYHHLWTTVCLNDQPPAVVKARRRANTSDTLAGSRFEEFRRNSRGKFIAVEVIKRLLREVRARHVILSDSSGGRATAAELHEVISSVGRVMEVQ
jgi:adenine-specific DNA-methyltransferase